MRLRAAARNDFLNAGVQTRGPRRDGNGETESFPGQNISRPDSGRQADREADRSTDRQPDQNERRCFLALTRPPPGFGTITEADGGKDHVGFDVD